MVELGKENINQENSLKKGRHPDTLKADVACRGATGVRFAVPATQYPVPGRSWWCRSGSSASGDGACVNPALYIPPHLPHQHLDTLEARHLKVPEIDPGPVLSFRLKDGSCVTRRGYLSRALVPTGQPPLAQLAVQRVAKNNCS
ncbi:hypothetical protein NDU88_003157 [Pleurodeles waltl]|uniref:Uncharacterized protein n=1 Tax=Pleurodeles waltl TaxID=8319 RepID=A0AAV7UD79_PLEWA|nr:hypothetical protein NDU88_003157 [Pleurodeles waltl]